METLSCSVVITDQITICAVRTIIFKFNLIKSMVRFRFRLGSGLRVRGWGLLRFFADAYYGIYYYCYYYTVQLYWNAFVHVNYTVQKTQIH